MLDKKRKDAVIKKFKIHSSDTGSAEVQIALLTEEIKELTEHLKEHKKDFSSRRGLLRKVGTRRKLLKFLEKDNPQSFESLVKKLKLKKFENLVAKKTVEEEDDDSQTDEEKNENDA